MDEDTSASSVHHQEPSEVVEQWFHEVLNSLPAVALSTWTHLVAAKDELKRRLEKETN